MAVNQMSVGRMSERLRVSWAGQNRSRRDVQDGLYRRQSLVDSCGGGRNMLQIGLKPI